MRVLFWLIVAILTLISVVHVERGEYLFHGPTLALVAGTLIAIGLAVMAFNRVQTLLLLTHRIDRKVATPYDIFPVILLIPFALSFPIGGEGWQFIWGPPERAFIFVAILALIFFYRVVRLLDLVVAHTRKNNP